MRRRQAGRQGTVGGRSRARWHLGLLVAVAPGGARRQHLLLSWNGGKWRPGGAAAEWRQVAAQPNGGSWRPEQAPNAAPATLLRQMSPVWNWQQMAPAQT